MTLYREALTAHGIRSRRDLATLRDGQQVAGDRDDAHPISHRRRRRVFTSSR
jgi:hypothetical protein